MRMNHAFAAIACCALGIGCGGPSRIPAPFEIVEVTGAVTLADGKPLPTGRLKFEPEPGQNARSEIAMVKAGKFSSSMAAGKYRVSIDVESGSRHGVLAKYRSLKTSDLIVDVSKSNASLTISFK